MPTQKHFQIPENITIKNSKTQNRYGQNRKKKKYMEGDCTQERNCRKGKKTSQ